MTPYWVTLALLAYLLVLTYQLDPAVDTKLANGLSFSTSTRICLTAAAAVLVCVAGLRWGIGTDYFGYYKGYSQSGAEFITALQAFDEPGIKGLAWATSQISDDAAAFMFAASSLTLIPILWTTVKHTNAVGMSLLLIVFVGTWHGSFNGVRQFLACAVIFAGHRFIVDRRLIPYALVVVVASSIHISALAMAVLYLVPTKQLSRRMVVLLAALALGALYSSDFMISLFETVDESLEVTEYVTHSINPLRVAVAVAPVLLYWSPGVRTRADGQWFYRNMAVVHAAVVLAASWSAYLTRFSIYTTAFLPLVLPRLIDFPDRRLTALTRAAVTLLFAVYWYTEVSSSSALNDFRFIWERQGALQ